MRNFKIKMILYALMSLCILNSCQDEVENPYENTSIKIFKELSVELGVKMQLEAVVSGDIDVQELGWLSYNPDMVSVDSEGNIETLKSGTATIKVYLLDNPTIFTRCNIIVKPDAFLGKWETSGEIEVTVWNFDGNDELTYPIDDFIKVCNDTVALTTSAEVRTYYANYARFSMWNNSIFEKDFTIIVNEEAELDVELERGIYHVPVSDGSWYRSKEYSGYVVNYVEHHTDTQAIVRETLVEVSEDKRSAVMSVYPFDEAINIKVKLIRIEE